MKWRSETTPSKFEYINGEQIFAFIWHLRIDKYKDVMFSPVISDRFRSRWQLPDKYTKIISRNFVYVFFFCFGQISIEYNNDCNKQWNVNNRLIAATLEKEETIENNYRTPQLIRRKTNKKSKVFYEFEILCVYVSLCRITSVMMWTILCKVLSSR